MPPRTRAAAQSLNHLWITDDILAEAFNRFVRVSHSTSRHGSHVPGPLEARRRLAKRRMAMSAVAPSSGLPAGVDLFSLFGFGGTGAPVEIEKSWKWEAPLSRNIPSQIGGFFQPPPTSLGATSAVPKQSFPVIKKEVNAVAKDERDFTAVSRAAFQALLKSVNPIQTVDEDTIKPLIDFLESSADESDARNFSGLAVWLAERSVTSNAMDIFHAAVVERIKLDHRWRSEVAQIIATLIKQQAPKLDVFLASMLKAYGADKFYARSFLTLTTKELLQSTPKTEPDMKLKQETIQNWLNLMATCPEANAVFGNTLRPQIYYEVFEHYAPKDLIGHFGRLPWQHLALILLRHRTRGLVLNEKGTAMYSDAIRHVPLSRNADRSHIDGWWKVEDLMKAYKTRREHATVLRNRVANRLGPLVDVLLVLQEKGLPYKAMCEEMFDILNQSKTMHSLDEFWRCLRRGKDVRDKLPVSDRLLDLMIQRLLRVGDEYHVRRAFLIFMQYPHLPLSRFPELPLKLLKFFPHRPHMVFRVLQRVPSVDKLSIEGRDHVNQMLTTQHIEIVHLVAHHWSKCERITAREAYRRVWECYRFLKDRQAPLEPVISRSLVHAGVLRYLQASQRVPSAQMVYILDIVGKIEGQGIAETLDRRVYSMWNKMIPSRDKTRALRRSREAPATDKRVYRQSGWASNKRAVSRQTRYKRLTLKSAKGQSR